MNQRSSKNTKQADFTATLTIAEESMKQHVVHAREFRGPYALGTLHFLLSAVAATFFTTEQQSQFDHIFKMHQFCQWGSGTYEEWCMKQAQQEESKT